MKFKNLKCGIVEEPHNKFAEEQMRNHPEMYEPIDEKKAEAKAEKPKAEAKK